MVHYYCPTCWREFHATQRQCVKCGEDLQHSLDDNRYIESILHALNRHEPSILMRACWVLGRIRDPRAAAPLIHLMQRTSNPFVVAAASDALGRIAPPEAAFFLETLTHHPAKTVIETARAALPRLNANTKEDRTMTPFSIMMELPGKGSVILSDLVMDFSGTLSLEGVLLPGVAERLTEIAERMPTAILTADTYGKARESLAGMPVDIRIVESAMDKAFYVETVGSKHVIAIGNGRNDVAMLDRAELAIAVIGPEGAAAELLRVADIVVCDINDALDMILNPTRIKATLRD